MINEQQAGYLSDDSDDSFHSTLESPIDEVFAVLEQANYSNIYIPEQTNGKT